MWARLARSISSVSSHSYDTFPDDDDISLTAHTDSADTEGDWVEVVASVGASDVWFVGFYVALVTGNADKRLSFGTGVGASEVSRAVFPHYIEKSSQTVAPVYGQYFSIPFPLFVPSGTREAARLKSGNAAADTAVVVEHHALSLGA